MKHIVSAGETLPQDSSPIIIQQGQKIELAARGESDFSEGRRGQKLINMQLTGPRY